LNTFKKRLIERLNKQDENRAIFEENVTKMLKKLLGEEDKPPA